MTKILGVALMVLALAACSKKQEALHSYADSAQDTGASKLKENLSPAPADLASAPPAPQAQVQQPSAALQVKVAGPQVAYTYSFGVQAPAGRIAGLVAAHEKACTAAGPALCEVVRQSVNQHSVDSVEASLTLRAAPVWFARFRSDLPGQAKAAGGRVLSSGVDSEDLTREIVDTDAALRAKTTLRDRLQTLLATHPGRVSDLLEVERELARVQGEIDAAQSELNVMRGRVAMSEVSLTYAAEGVLAPRGAWMPLRGAVEGFLGTVATSLAVIIMVVGALLPWLGLAAAAIWLGRKRLARLARFRTKATPATKP
jgi:hypothetical protein